MSIVFKDEGGHVKTMVLHVLLCVQVEWQPYPLGSAFQTQTCDHWEVSESHRREVSATDRQREGGR